MPALPLELSTLPLLWLVVAGACVLRSFTGFGFALAAVPALAMFLPPQEVVVLVAGLSLALGIQTFPQYAGQVGLRREWPLFVTVLCGTVVGVSLLRLMSAEVFRLLIGLLVILASVGLSFFYPRRRPVGVGIRVGTGLASGLMNGLFSIPGPPVIIYVMATRGDPVRGRALMIALFSFAALVALGNHAINGWVSLQLLCLLLLVYPAMYLGDKLGYRLFLRYGGALYRRVAIVTLMCIGVSITLRAMMG